VAEEGLAEAPKQSGEREPVEVRWLQKLGLLTLTINFIGSNLPCL
jgi:hypothetical protein